MARLERVSATANGIQRETPMRCGAQSIFLAKRRSCLLDGLNGVFSSQGVSAFPLRTVVLGLRADMALLHAKREAISRSEVPTMANAPSLRDCSVLIVDGVSLSAADMSNRLSAMGARVHVVTNTASAMLLARTKRLSVAMIGFRHHEGTAALKRTLDEYGVPYIICAAPRKAEHVDYERVFSLALAPAA